MHSSKLLTTVPMNGGANVFFSERKLSGILGCQGSQKQHTKARCGGAHKRVLSQSASCLNMLLLVVLAAQCAGELELEEKG